ncbi:9504_t:CDS:2, partial [Racocetra fulgida]
MSYDLKSLSFESLEPALIFYHRIELKLWTGNEEKEANKFYNAIEYALQDELLENQRKEKLLLLKKTPEISVIQEFQNNTILKWIISESSIASL